MTVFVEQPLALSGSALDTIWQNSQNLFEKVCKDWEKYNLYDKESENMGGLWRNHH